MKGGIKVYGNFSSIIHSFGLTFGELIFEKRIVINKAHNWLGILHKDDRAIIYIEDIIWAVERKIFFGMNYGLIISSFYLYGLH